MADYRTEEEQVELLKKWWNENGKATVLGVVIALSGYGGWMGWTSHQKSVMGSAADVYQQMVAADNAGEVAKVVEYGEALQKNYPNTVYGVFAALGIRLYIDTYLYVVSTAPFAAVTFNRVT